MSSVALARGELWRKIVVEGLRGCEAVAPSVDGEGDGILDGADVATSGNGRGTMDKSSIHERAGGRGEGFHIPDTTGGGAPDSRGRGDTSGSSIHMCERGDIILQDEALTGAGLSGTLAKCRELSSACVALVDGDWTEGGGMFATCLGEEPLWPTSLRSAENGVWLLDGEDDGCRSVPWSGEP